MYLVQAEPKCRAHQLSTSLIQGPILANQPSLFPLLDRFSPAFRRAKRVSAKSRSAPGNVSLDNAGAQPTKPTLGEEMATGIEISSVRKALFGVVGAVLISLFVALGAGVAAADDTHWKINVSAPLDGTDVEIPEPVINVPTDTHW
jgi:hypothetical protein